MSKPKPVPPDPARDGTLSVVVAFRCQPNGGWDQDTFERGLQQHLGDWLRPTCERFGGLSVAIRIVGAQGEASQFEGTGP